MITIYALVCPMSGEIRYIGKTEKTPERRLIAHLTESRSRGWSHKNRWIRKCLAAGSSPQLWILEEVADGVRWQERERAWIGRAMQLGLPLTNQTAGGEGLDFIDPITKENYRKVHSEISRERYYSSPERRAALIEGSKRSWAENREARLEAAKKGWTPEAKARHAEAMEKVRSAPGWKERKMLSAKDVWPTHREKILEAFARPETKEKHSAAIKAAWGDDAKRARLMNRWTPEAKAKQAQAIRDRSTPEYRALMAEKTKARWAAMPPEQRAEMLKKTRAGKRKP